MIELEAEALTLRGDAVATVDGDEIHVPGLYAGERAEVEIVNRSRHHRRAHARLHMLLTPHAARRHPPCERHGHCSGCPLIELSVEAQREQKRGMLARLGLEVSAVRGDARESGYRWSSKRVAYDHRGLRLGSYHRGTHDGAWMRGCWVDHPQIAAAFDELEQVARQLGVRAYDEESGAGELRYAWAKTDGEAVLLTIIEAREGALDRSIADALTVPAGVAFAAQPAQSNAIRGTVARVERGIEGLTVDGVDIGPLGFLQPNPELIAAAYEALLVDEAGAPLEGALAWDLYAGAGAIRRRLERGFGEVVSVESDPELSVAPQTVEAFLAAQAQPPEFAVLNPPRRGLGKAVCAALSRLGAPRLHIMSCGPEGLRDDVARLEGYRQVSLEAFDTLPQTPHVELVAKLVRR